MTPLPATAADRFTAAWVRNDRRGLVLRLGQILPAALVLAIIQPFETDTVPFALRLAYWGILVGLFALLGGLAVLATVRLLGEVLAHTWQRWLASAALIALPMMLPVKLLDRAMAVWIAPLAGVAVDPPMQGVEIFTEALWLYVAVFTIVAILLAIPVLWSSPQAVMPAGQEQGQGQDAPAGPPASRFLERLSPHLGKELVSIRTEDHYLLVQTVLGSELLLMRMADAVAELVGYPGFRVHRSWWVASDQIAEVKRSGRRIELVLADGQQVPVSASYRGELDRMP